MVFFYSSSDETKVNITDLAAQMKGEREAMYEIDCQPAFVFLYRSRGISVEEKYKYKVLLHNAHITGV